MMKRTIPALPARLIDPRPVIAAGTAAWLVSLATLLVVGVHTTAMWVAVCGIAVGIVIYAIFAWQRSAVRRGAATAQTSLPDVQRKGDEAVDRVAVSYTHLTLPTIAAECRSRWSPYH